MARHDRPLRSPRRLGRAPLRRHARCRRRLPRLPRLRPPPSPRTLRRRLRRTPPPPPPYLTDNIDFTLDPENIAALTRFFVEASSLDLTPSAKPVLLAPGPNRLVLESAPIASVRGSLNGRSLDTLYEERKRNREL